MGVGHPVSLEQVKQRINAMNASSVRALSERIEGDIEVVQAKRALDRAMDALLAARQAAAERARNAHPEDEVNDRS